MTRKRVLVADDQDRTLTAVSALLGESFEVVGLASDGQMALEAALRLEPDLLVLDVSMPNMNGIEVAKELKKRINGPRIVFLTVYEDHEVLANCFAAGALGYVVKSSMDNDLIPAMNEALAGRVFVSHFD